MAKEKWIRADELMQHLEAATEWVAARDSRDAGHAERAKRIVADEVSILSDLAGCSGPQFLDHGRS